jgi:hypothetical protein
VVAENELRRSLTDSQKAMVAAKIANYKQGLAKLYTHHGPGHGVSTNATRREAAKLLKVNPAVVDDVRTVLNRGADNIVQMVTNGQISASAARRGITDISHRASSPSAFRRRFGIGVGDDATRRPSSVSSTPIMKRS